MTVCDVFILTNSVLVGRSHPSWKKFVQNWWVPILRTKVCWRIKPELKHWFDQMSTSQIKWNLKREEFSSVYWTMFWVCDTFRGSDQNQKGIHSRYQRMFWTNRIFVYFQKFFLPPPQKIQSQVIFFLKEPTEGPKMKCFKNFHGSLVLK